MSGRASSSRYAPRQQLLHWLSAVVMFSVLAVAWAVMSSVEESRSFFLWLDIHESLGLSVLALTLLRLVWRISDRAPCSSLRTPSWMKRLAVVAHCGLFVLMILMPVSGYLWSMGHGHDVAPFHFIQLPHIAFGNRRFGDIAEGVHESCQWILYSLIALHAAGTGYHVFVVRDGLLGRMLPAPVAFAKARPTDPGSVPPAD